MTKDEIIKMAKQAGGRFSRNPDEYDVMKITYCGLEAFAKLVAEKERESCAEICDGFYLSWIDIQGRYEFMGEGASECAGAIRARGNND